MKKLPAVSVIIASHRPAMLGGLLHSLLRQNASGDLFEVLVITDFRNGHYQDEYPAFRWLYIPDISISKKRNAGAAIAKAPILAFIDDDCIADADWVTRGSAYLDDHPETAAVEGATVIEDLREYSPRATREYRRLEKKGFRTNNLFFRTMPFKAVGGFDERFTVQREDIDLAFSSLDRGYTIDYSRTIKVTHRFRHWEKWDLLKNCWNRRFDPLLFKKHPKRYLRMFGSPLPPTSLVVLSAHALVILSIRRKRWPVPAAGIDAALAVFLGVRRCGIRPFSIKKWLLEGVQVGVAPLVILGALLYGWLVLVSETTPISYSKKHR
jgi:glycosyltransferase involved in cell wall biosynthesis